MKNANLKKDPITTIFGVIMISISIAMGVGLFLDYTEYTHVKSIVTVSVLVVGILFLRSPDSLVVGAKKVIDKGTDKL